MRESKKYLWLLFPVAHFLASFLYEKTIFKYDESSWDLFWSTSLSERVGNVAQSHMLYVYGKAAGAVLIFLLWYLIHKIFRLITDKKVSKFILIIAIILFLAIGFYFFAFWPSSFYWDDSLTMYGFAIRLIPWYWHHYLTSAWCVGCLTVLPHPLAIPIIQYICFCFVMLYIFSRMLKSFKRPVLGTFIFALLILAPATFYLVTQFYRNCIYAIILMFYIAYLLLENVEQAEYTPLKMVILCGLSAILSVWRTEGLLIGIVGILLSCFKIYKIKKNDKILIIMTYIVMFMCLFIPQKIGDDKYYGKDYLIVSTLEPVRSILNDSGVNLNYKGAADDIAAIGEYAPVSYIRQGGIEAVRGYFYENGHIDFDQSCVGADVQKNYLKAFVRLAIHNPMPYIKCQLNLTMKAIGIDYRFDMGEYTGEPIETSYSYTFYNVGREDLLSAHLVSKYVNNNWHKYQELVGRIVIATFAYREAVERYPIFAILKVFVILLDIVIFVGGVVCALVKRKPNIISLVLSGLFIAQFSIITMTIPTGYSPYFYAVFYPNAVFMAIWLCEKENLIRKRLRRTK